MMAIMNNNTQCCTNNKKRIFLTFVLFVSFLCGRLSAQENVYVSTDKECYLAGESIWCSVYCLGTNNGNPASGLSTEPAGSDTAGVSLSHVSSVAYLEFYSLEGLVGSIKVALIDGRGCGRFEIPFSIPTGNYSIVAFTRYNGGASIGEYNGKIVTIFNTLTSKRVKGGVEVLDKERDFTVEGVRKINSKEVSVELPKKSFVPGEKALFRLHNLGEKATSLNISVYHLDRVTRLIGENGYNKSSLIERTGQFETTNELDYEGEMIHGRVYLKGNGKTKETFVAGKNVYMSAMGGGMDDIYVTASDSLGNIKYTTNNIYGQRDLVFDVVEEKGVASVPVESGADTSLTCYVEIINKAYKHTPADIPVLKISPALSGALSDRGANMQITKRFEADTLFDLLPIRSNPLLGGVTPFVYNLDEYTRFPVMEEVVREYVKELRIRKYEGNTDFQILWEEGKNSFVFSRGYTLALLDGVPVRNHALLAGFDPLLVKQIVIYPRQFVLGNYLYDGMVCFNTYKGNMGGIKLNRNMNIVNYKGVQHPLAFSGKGMEYGRYPNYHETVYWNPIVNLKGGDSFEFDCVMPVYKGDFKIVIEGIDVAGEDIYYTVGFSVE